MKIKLKFLLVTIFLSLFNESIASCNSLYERTLLNHGYNKKSLDNEYKEDLLSFTVWTKLNRFFSVGLMNKRFSIAKDKDNLRDFVNNCYSRLTKNSDLIDYAECYTYDMVDVGYHHINDNSRYLMNVAPNFVAKQKKHIELMSNKDCAESISGFFSSVLHAPKIVENYKNLLKAENKWFLNVEPVQKTRKYRLDSKTTTKP